MKYSEEQLQKEINNVIFGASKREHKNVSSFAVIGYKPDRERFVVDCQFNTICHADMRTYKGDLGDLKAIITFLSKDHISYVGDQEAIPFMDYLFNRSPYKDAYITKNPEEALTKGILLNIDAPNTLVGAAAIITRIMWEWPNIFTMYKKLLVLGAQEDMALIGAHICSGQEGQYIYQGLGDNHKALFGSNMSTESVIGFIRRQPLPTQSMRERQDSYGSPSRTFGEQYVGRRNKYFITEFSKGLPVLGEGWARVSGTETLDDFVKYLNDSYDVITEVKEKVEVIANPELPVRKRYLYMDFQVIKDICVENGFTLMEVRTIRKQLRDIIDNLDDHEWRKKELLINCFTWDETPQGFDYWHDIDARLTFNKQRNVA